MLFRGVDHLDLFNAKKQRKIWLALLMALAVTIFIYQGYPLNFTHYMLCFRYLNLSICCGNRRTFGQTNIDECLQRLASFSK
jgi:hypothetical protein